MATLARVNMSDLKTIARGLGITCEKGNKKTLVSMIIEKCEKGEGEVCKKGEGEVCEKGEGEEEEGRGREEERRRRRRRRRNPPCRSS